jgi:hypothetical protein
MTFLLSSQNAAEYLVEHGIYTQEEQALSQVEPKLAKNFNLLLSLPGGRKLLIKQEPYDLDGKTAGEFLREWRIHEFLQRFPELSYLSSWLSEALHFEAEHSIIVFNYLDNYRDLTDFYAKENIFPTEIATTIGAVLASIHRLTLDRQDHWEFFSQNSQDGVFNQASNLKRELERIGPEVFGQVPDDGLKFFALYQRYDSLGKAIAELSTAFEACCLTHNDLKLNNILLSIDWQQAVSQAERTAPDSPEVQENLEDRIIRVIDWERSSWGDPAYDLGMLIASYLGIWLGSLVFNRSIGIEEGLRLTMTPLELLQPSIVALTSTYFQNFPAILERRPDFLRRVMQFSGLALIQVIQSMLQYQKSFDNTGICLLQVAKSLLCRPEASIRTVFGIEESELTRRMYSPI